MTGLDIPGLKHNTGSRVHEQKGEGVRTKGGLEKKLEGDSVTGRRIEKSHLSASTFFLLFNLQGETIRKEERS